MQETLLYICGIRDTQALHAAIDKQDMLHRQEEEKRLLLGLSSRRSSTKQEMETVRGIAQTIQLPREPSKLEVIKKAAESVAKENFDDAIMFDEPQTMILRKGKKKKKKQAGYFDGAFGGKNKREDWRHIPRERNTLQKLSKRQRNRFDRQLAEETTTAETSTLRSTIMPATFAADAAAKTIRELNTENEHDRFRKTRHVPKLTEYVNTSCASISL